MPHRHRLQPAPPPLCCWGTKATSRKQLRTRLPESFSYLPAQNIAFCFSQQPQILLYQASLWTKYKCLNSSWGDWVQSQVHSFPKGKTSAQQGADFSLACDQVIPKQHRCRSNRLYHQTLILNKLPIHSQTLILNKLPIHWLKIISFCLKKPTIRENKMFNDGFCEWPYVSTTKCNCTDDTNTVWMIVNY